MMWTLQLVLGFLFILNGSSVFAETNVYYDDDFVTDSIPEYTVNYTQTDGGVGQLLYDSTGQRALVKTGDNVGLALSHSVIPTNSGTFSIDFLPTKKYPTGGILDLKLSQDENNYYRLYVTDGYAAGLLIKYVNGVRVDSSNFVQGYSQNNSYVITVDFSPEATTVKAFGQVVKINANLSNIQVNSFSIDLSQQDAYLDNIHLENVNLASQPPDAINDEASTHTDTPVVIDVLANDTDPNDDIDPATVIIVTNAANGSTVVSGDGRITYAPFAGYAGGDSFTYTVADSSGLRSNQATVNLTVSDQAIYFGDDFSVNSISEYTVKNTQTDGGVGQLSYDSTGQRALVKTGDNVGLALSHSVSPTNSGTFSVDFLPTKKYPTGGILNLKLSQDQNNYYQVYVTDGYAAGLLIKYVNGVRVDSSNFVQGYSQNNSYVITVDFSPEATTVKAFGQVVKINANLSNIQVNSFSIELSQQDAYLDNIYLEKVILASQPPDAINDEASTHTDTPVVIDVLANDTDPNDDIDPATVIIATNAANGSTVVGGDGRITYTPFAGYAGGDSFTYTVADSSGLRSNQATVNLTVSDQAIYFGDDFSVNSISEYTVKNTQTDGGVGQLSYDSTGQRALVKTGDNVGLALSHSVSPTNSGTFSVDFLPTKKYPTGGILNLKLSQDQNNYYQVYVTDGYAAGLLIKYVNGVRVDSSNFVQGYSQNNSYVITVDFSPEATTVKAFGQVVKINANLSNIQVNSFSIELSQQDAYLDNIYLEKVILAGQPPDAINDEASTHTDTPVVIDVLANDTDPNDDIDPATVIIATNAANGSTVVGGDGRITYTPFAGYAGGDSFTYTVADSSGLRSNQATVNLTVSDQAIYFGDDFSVNSISEYTVKNTQTDGGVGQLLYDSTGQRALVKTGDNVGLALSHSVSPTNSGTFSVDFLPTKKYPAGGILNLKLSQDQNNYYQVYVTDGYAAGLLIKYVNGVRVDSSNFVQGYSQNNSYAITVDFSPEVTIS